MVDLGDPCLEKVQRLRSIATTTSFALLKATHSPARVKRVACECPSKHEILLAGRVSPVFLARTH